MPRAVDQGLFYWLDFGSMSEEPVSAEGWWAWVQEQIAAGHVVNLADWIQFRIRQPEVMAKIDGLGSEEAAKVYEGVEWVLHDFRNTGTVSDAAIKNFAKIARRMLGFMPILFLSALKKADALFKANPQH